jgi:hypothetical protein
MKGENVMEGRKTNINESWWNGGSVEARPNTMPTHTRQFGFNFGRGEGGGEVRVNVFEGHSFKVQKSTLGRAKTSLKVRSQISHGRGTASVCGPPPRAGRWPRGWRSSQYGSGNQWPDCGM